VQEQKASSKENPSPEVELAKERNGNHKIGPTRRQLLGGMSAVTAAAWAAGAVGVSPLLGSKATTVDAKECAPFVNNPSDRISSFQNIRDTATQNAAKVEATVFPHPTNGDEETYANQFFAGNFQKSLPLDKNLALVSPVSAYNGANNSILAACTAGTKAAWDAVPAGASPLVARFVGPLDGLTFNIEGPDSPDSTSVVPPSISSAAKAAETVELYWEAFCRDVPFINFASNPLIAQAVTDISKLSAYQGPTPVTSQNIFRYGIFGNPTAPADSLLGPYISQILFRTHRLDGVDFVPMMHTRLPVSDPNTGNVIGPGFDIMTNFTEYLQVETGAAAPATPFDTQVRFIRSIRDLGTLSASDLIYSIYFRAVPVLLALGVPLNPGNPFNGDTRQVPFGLLGIAHLLNMIGAVEKAERHTFYHKWYVHRHLRPEAMGNLVDGVVSGRFQKNHFTLSPGLHSDLTNSAVLNKIFTYNQQLNNMRGFGNVGSFFLPQELQGGSPTHPSAPAGHAISAGACVTILKAWFNTSTIWTQLIDPLTGMKVVPKQAEADGLLLADYTASDASQMTVLGELNKLAFNISEGRNMSGIHWRVADNVAGMLQGEALAIRILNEAGATYPVGFAGFTLTKFDGTTVTVGGNGGQAPPPGGGDNSQSLLVTL